MVHKLSVFVFSVTIISILISGEALAQNDPDPRGAFLRSLVLPGWGHHYADSDSWGRGAVHLGADAVLIASYAGLIIRSSNLLEQYTTLAKLKAGADISDRSRSYQLAMTNFNTLQDYNEFQLRNRNWNQLLDDIPENRWNWSSSKDRERFNDLRSDRESAKNQIPVVASLLVLNRVFSAVNAYSRARKKSKIPELTLAPQYLFGDTGFIATLRFRY